MELNMNNTYIKAIIHENYKFLFGKNTSQCPDLYLEIKLRCVWNNHLSQGLCSNVKKWGNINPYWFLLTRIHPLLAPLSCLWWGLLWPPAWISGSTSKVVTFPEAAFLSSALPVVPSEEKSNLAKLQFSSCEYSKEALAVYPPYHSGHNPSDRTPTHLSLYLLPTVPLPEAYSHILLQLYLASTWFFPKVFWAHAVPSTFVTLPTLFSG